MKKTNDFSTVFDDDFEVTYEEDSQISFDEEEPDLRKNRYEEEEESHWEEYMGDEELYAEEDDYDEEYDTDPSPVKIRRRQESAYDERPSRQRKRKTGVPLAAPIRKGGRLLSRITDILLGQFTSLVIIASCIYVSYTFWKASAPYGDIETAIRTKTITQKLAAYLCVAAAFLIFEFFSLLWSMTRTRVRDGFRSRKEDTGRGLNSFVFVLFSSYLAFWFNRYLPQTPDLAAGVRGGLEVYGSMHNALTGLCAAGIVSCLIRKYKRN